MYKVSKYNQGAIYRTANNQYVYQDEEITSEAYSSVFDLVSVMQTNEKNDKVPYPSERDNADNSKSQTKKKPRKKTARKSA